MKMLRLNVFVKRRTEFRQHTLVQVQNYERKSHNLTKMPQVSVNMESAS